MKRFAQLLLLIFCFAVIHCITVPFAKHWYNHPDNTEITAKVVSVQYVGKSSEITSICTCKGKDNRIYNCTHYGTYYVGDTVTIQEHKSFLSYYVIFFASILLIIFIIIIIFF